LPKGNDWASLRSKTGEPLEAHYLATLHKLGLEPGMLVAIFFKAQNKIQNPAKLSRLVQLIDAENWVGMDTDAKGDLYEGLLQKNAEDTKSGAGQFFTPRALIQAMVACMRPQPLKSIADPACGTGGFFLVANEWLSGTGDWIERNAAWLDYEAPKLDRKKSFPARRDISWQRNRAKYAPPVPDEPLFAQHRRAGRRTVGGAFRRADCRTEVARRLRAGQSAFR
jgi:type I restriction enzyme M protein